MDLAVEDVLTDEEVNKLKTENTKIKKRLALKNKPKLVK